MTNGDYIRQWTDEQIADFVAGLLKSTMEDIYKGLGFENDLPDELYKAVYDEYLAWLKKKAEPTKQDGEEG